MPLSFWHVRHWLSSWQPHFSSLQVLQRSGQCVDAPGLEIELVQNNIGARRSKQASGSGLPLHVGVVVDVLLVTVDVVVVVSVLVVVVVVVVPVFDVVVFEVVVFVRVVVVFVFVVLVLVVVVYVSVVMVAV